MEAIGHKAGLYKYPSLQEPFDISELALFLVNSVGSMKLLYPSSLVGLSPSNWW